MKDNLNWYVAYVRSCQERKIAGSLTARGIETYVPVQKVVRKWSDRMKTVDKLVIPGLVFVHCSEATRRSVFNLVYGVCRFLTDRGDPGHRALTVPQKQMDDFIKVVNALSGEDDIEVVESSIAPGDVVRVVKGPLSGFVCECVEVQRRHKLIIRLGLPGSVLVNIAASDVVKEDGACGE